MANLTDVPLNDFNNAVDEIQRNWRPRFGFNFPPVYDVLDAVMTVRGRRILAEQSKEILSRPDKPLEKADLVKAGVKLGVTKAEIDQWLKEAHQAHAAHVAKLAADPEWQRLHEKFGRPGLEPKAPRNWDSEDEKAKWAKDTAKSNGWRRNDS